MVLKRSSSSKPVKQRSEKNLLKPTLPKKDECHSSSLPSNRNTSPIVERGKLPGHSNEGNSPSSSRRASQKSLFAMANPKYEEFSPASAMEASSPSAAKKAALRMSFGEIMTSELSSQVTPQNKPKKMSEFAKTLLQNNSNHIAVNNISIMGAGVRKPVEDGINLRDKIKASFNQGANLQKSSLIENGLMSPSCSTIGQNRELMGISKRKSRATVCNSPFIDQNKTKTELKPIEIGKNGAQSNNTTKIGVHRRTRTTSMELFRALRREDSTETVKFPSIFKYLISKFKQVNIV